MENTTFSSKEIDVLIEALDAWEKKDFGAELLSVVLGSMLGNDDPVAKQRFDDDMIDEKEKREKEAKVRCEVSVLLKAKLIYLKQSQQIERVTQ